MNSSDIDKLEAGRELDALVAEGMGLKVVAHDWPCGYDPECGYYGAAMTNETEGLYLERGPVTPRVDDGWPPKQWPDDLEPDKFFASVTPIPFYSTEISDAWQVVEKLDSEGWDWGIDADDVYFQKGDSDSPDFKCGTALSFGLAGIELAICRAALKAKLKGGDA